MGYPVIKARLRDGSKLHLKQNRFLATGDVKAKDDIALWHVPLQLRTFGANGKTELHSIVLSERETVIDLKGAESFLLNAG
jgi:aminopeptidase 2